MNVVRSTFLGLMNVVSTLILVLGIFFQAILFTLNSRPSLFSKFKMFSKNNLVNNFSVSLSSLLFPIQLSVGYVLLIFFSGKSLKI